MANLALTGRVVMLARSHPWNLPARGFVMGWASFAEDLMEAVEEGLSSSAGTGNGDSGGANSGQSGG